MRHPPPDDELAGNQIDYCPHMAENVVIWHPLIPHRLLCRDALSFRAWLESEILERELQSGFPPRR